MRKVSVGWRLWKDNEKRKAKEVAKNLPAFNAEYEQLCAKHKICLKPRIEPAWPANEVRLYLAAIHLEDQKPQFI